MRLVWLIIPLVLFSVVGMSDSFGQTVQWSVQFGSSSFEGGHSVTVGPSGNAYVTGTTSGSLSGTNVGSDDAFVVKYDPDGNEVWAKQFGNNSLEEHSGIAVNSSGNVYITGVINGNLSGTNIGSDDVFITKYAKNGIEKWTKQFGSSSFEGGNGVAIDSSGNVYITGITTGDLFGTNEGENDVFVVKYDFQSVTSQPSLKHQIENTIPINEITCKNENHLLVERTNKKLACVYLNAAEKLGWKSINSDVIILSQSVKESLLMRYQDVPEVVAFYAKYNDAQASVREDHISYVSGSDEGLKIRMNLFFNEDNAIIDKSLTCYYKRAFQFESSSEDVPYRLQSNECKQSTNGFDLSKIGEN